LACFHGNEAKKNKKKNSKWLTEKSSVSISTNFGTGKLENELF
jgi:hypothetical protein